MSTSTSNMSPLIDFKKLTLTPEWSQMSVPEKRFIKNNYRVSRQQTRILNIIRQSARKVAAVKNMKTK